MAQGTTDPRTRWEQLADRETGNSEALMQIYADVFPVDVRYLFCRWFEGSSWEAVDPSNPTHVISANVLFMEMVSEINKKLAGLELSHPDLYIVKVRLEQFLKDFQPKYEGCPTEFVKLIRGLMKKEIELLGQVTGTGTGEEDENQTMDMDQTQRQTDREIIKTLKELSLKQTRGEEQFDQLQHKQESFIIQYQDNLKIGTLQQQYETQGQKLTARYHEEPEGTEEKMALAQQIKDKTMQFEQTRQEKKLLEKQLSDLGQEILNLRVEMQHLYRTIITEVQVIQKKILDEELINYKRRQQLGGNGKLPDKAELDMLQQWCEMLAELIWSIRQQLKRLGLLRTQLPIELPNGMIDLQPELTDTITGMLSSLVTSSFIVETQPPQVLKKDSRFSCTVRLLVGGKLNVQMNPPQVKATVISEFQARSLLRSEMFFKSQTTGTILNNTGTMDFQAPVGPYSAGSLSVHFRNMQLKTIKRSDKRGSEAVTEEKFCILFQSDFNIGGNDLVFQVWTLSLPVVVTVHGNQESNAMATVLWDNAFSEPGRVMFNVPDVVPWPQLAEQLDQKFRQMSGRGLTQDNLDYLATKIFNHYTPEMVQSDYSQCMVSWTQFNKDPLQPDRHFTFWEWFHGVVKLTKEHLKGPWGDGYIVGFISKIKAQECLNQKQNGTFLLRFSDSGLGGITIAWIAENQQGLAEREVWNLAPYFGRDFAIRGLADRVFDLKNLLVLYPNVSKEEAFSKYCATAQEADNPHPNGYVVTELVNRIKPQTGMTPTADHGARVDDQAMEDIVWATDYDTSDIPDMSFINSLINP